MLWVKFSESAKSYFTAKISQNLESLLKSFYTQNRMEATASKSWGITVARSERKLSYCLWQANKKRMTADLPRNWLTLVEVASLLWIQLAESGALCLEWPNTDRSTFYHRVVTTDGFNLPQTQHVSASVANVIHHVNSEFSEASFSQKLNLDLSSIYFFIFLFPLQWF